MLSSARTENSSAASTSVTSCSFKVISNCFQKLFSTRGGGIDSILRCVFYVKFDVFNTDVGQEIYHVFKVIFNCPVLFRYKINFLGISLLKFYFFFCLFQFYFPFLSSAGDCVSFRRHYFHLLLISKGFFMFLTVNVFIEKHTRMFIMLTRKSFPLDIMRIRVLFACFAKTNHPLSNCNSITYTSFLTSL